MVRDFLFVLSALVFVFSAVSAAEPPVQPDARARAALALAKTKQSPPPAAAPAPRPVVKVYPDYAAVKAASVAQNVPAVIYVGYDARHPPVPVPGAVVACTPGIMGYDDGTVLVCFPQGGHLYVSETLKCPAADADVRKAVRAAEAKKSGKTVKTAIDWS